jgi:UDP-N-acetylmuramoylalanine--D-glutamate ligase
MILGTPRKKENWRYDIFIEVSKTKASIVALFPGLEDTVNLARLILEEKGFKGKIISLKGVDEVIEFTRKCIQKYDKVFIGGNGQKKIIEITNKLKENVIPA